MEKHEAVLKKKWRKTLLPSKRETVLCTALAAGLMAGCGNSQSAATSTLALPSHSSSVVVNQLALQGLPPMDRPFGIALHPGGAGSSTSPNVNRFSTLLYVTNTAQQNGQGTVTFYAWNRNGGMDLQGTITGFNYPTQPCGDASGNVYIPDLGNSQVTEFHFGQTTPVQTLPARYALGCSIDRAKTGNLAVATFNNHKVLIFPHAGGTPTQYDTADVTVPGFVAYDTNGDLFVIGVNLNDETRMAYLPFGGNAFSNFHLTGGRIERPANIQWGGTFLLVGDEGLLQQSYINQVTLNLSSGIGTIVQRIPLQGNGNLIGFWARGPGGDRRVVAVSEYGDFVGTYNWPAGTEINETTAGVARPFGAFILQRGTARH